MGWPPTGNFRASCLRTERRPAPRAVAFLGRRRADGRVPPRLRPQQPRPARGGHRRVDGDGCEEDPAAYEEAHRRRKGRDEGRAEGDEVLLDVGTLHPRQQLLLGIYSLGSAPIARRSGVLRRPSASGSPPAHSQLRWAPSKVAARVASALRGASGWRCGIDQARVVVMIDFSTYTLDQVVKMRDLELRRLDQQLRTFRNEIRDHPLQHAVAKLLAPTEALVGWIRAELGKRDRRR